MVGRPRSVAPGARPRGLVGRDHLAVLERDGLVTAHRSGRDVRYAVREERLDQARAALARTAAQWDTHLTAIKKMAEQAAKSGAER